ncbi:aminotransferase class I/II-fold pyridoxal phosphate-dependent enzyme [Bacteroides sp. 519]|uniref:aminotransferase class I/II-fold pyridoxal phosphate-dependent enzyme n=1 Tax=Bacteroides sp. 519 TaxID=2302937 RepID=UPI0013D229AC|nr:aminotransferase class I/II-fold pyridoxal phosphate-dependent enzyme [Bacteroides sp. 519]NDV60034.1 aminotransferase class I/II-fold pyridoxal phosphate-dependent enzyme [Bacteroides sp. 519]
MQAIILAAGMGKRLGELTKENTKCMIKVNDVYLIDRLLQQLSELKLRRIIIVIGYKGEKLKEHVGFTIHDTPIQYIENPIYDKTNNIYSLYLAKKQLQEDDTLLIESDLIFDASIFHRVLADTFPNLVVVAKYKPWMNGTMVQINETNDIVNFIPDKAFSYKDADTYYKTVNIYKFSKAFSNNSYVPFLEAYSKALGNNEYYEQVLRVITLLDNCELKALILDKESWYEIDDILDLDIAETIFAENNSLELYHKRFGGYWRFPFLKDFCYLVNPYFPPKRMKEEIKSNFDILLSEYPSGISVNSLLMARNLGIKPEYITIGNGAAELIKDLMATVEGNIGITYPTFEEYPNRISPERIIEYLPSNNGFTYSAQDLINYFDNKKLSVMLLINPDNPSGNFIEKPDLFILANWAQKQNILLIIDESFVDFSAESYQNTLITNDILEKYQNLVVIKSISKSYGVPGLRLGLMASACIPLITMIRKSLSIWNINSFAEFYMQIYNKYDTDYKNACKTFINERERFFTNLKEISYLRVIPSQANFFLCEIIARFSSSELSLILLKKYNILIKDCSKKAGFNNRSYIRIAIRNQADNDLIVKALKEIGE